MGTHIRTKNMAYENIYWTVIWHVEDHAEYETFEDEDDAWDKYQSLDGGDWATRIHTPEGRLEAEYGDMHEEDWDLLDQVVWKSSQARVQPLNAQTELLSVLAGISPSTISTLSVCSGSYARCGQTHKSSSVLGYTGAQTNATGTTSAVQGCTLLFPGPVWCRNTYVLVP